MDCFLNLIVLASQKKRQFKRFAFDNYLVSCVICSRACSITRCVVGVISVTHGTILHVVWCDVV